MTRLISLVVILSCAALVAAGQLSPRVSVVDGVVYVTEVGEVATPADLAESEWRKMFSVYTDEAFRKGLTQAVAGKYLSRAEGFSFEPIYPFASGAVYHAVFSPKGFSEVSKRIGHSKPNIKVFLQPESSDESLADRIDFVFQIPGENVLPTTVEAVYPTSAVLPENLLRMYVTFSGPMMPGEAYEHITLLNSKGEHIERPFLVVDQELWDVSRTRFTLLFDPGRIKRGLKANLELGPPLETGELYTLVIDSAWCDVNGNKLQRSSVKNFTVRAPVRTRLSTGDMKVIAPEAATRAPLVVKFDRSMDRVLLFKYISVMDTFGNSIRGALELNHDDVLTFTPDFPWSPGNYTVLLDPHMEDVAGNNFNNAFDVDLSREARLSSSEDLMVKFSVVSEAR